MSDCVLVVDAKPIEPLVAAVGSSAPPLVADARARPASFEADARAIVSKITASVWAVPTLTAAVAARPPIVAAVRSRPPIIVDVGGCLDPFIASIERAAERARRDVKKLAAYTTSINIPDASAVELPTGLIVYPSFRDTGLIEITLGGAHANMNGATLTLALMLGPSGALVNVANFTTPVINPTSGVGNFQLEFSLRLKSQGPTSHNYSGEFRWNDPGGVSTSPIIGRIVTSGTYTGFADPANGDNGDVEVRIDAYLSASGPTFNVRNYLIEQHSPRALSQ